MADAPEIMTTKEAADFCRFGDDTIRRWVKLGRLRVMRSGKRGQMRFRRSDVIAALDRYEYGDDQPRRDPSMG